MKKILAFAVFTLGMVISSVGCAAQSLEIDGYKIYHYGTMLNPESDFELQVGADDAAFFASHLLFKVEVCSAKLNPKFHCFFASGQTGGAFSFFAVPKGESFDEHSAWELNDVQFSVVDTLGVYWHGERHVFWVIKGRTQDGAYDHEYTYVYNKEFGLIGMFEELDEAMKFRGINFTSRSYILSSGVVGFGAE